MNGGKNEKVKYFYCNSFKSDYSTFKNWKSKKLNEIGIKLAQSLKFERPDLQISFCEETENGITKLNIG